MQHHGLRSDGCGDEIDDDNESRVGRPLTPSFAPGRGGGVESCTGLIETERGNVVVRFG